MKTTDTTSASESEEHEAVPTSASKKRKVDQAELEVDLDAPEPPSKKALRKAKKANATPATGAVSSTRQPTAEDPVPNAGKRSGYGIWIGNLSFTTSKQDLLNFVTSDADHPIPQDKVTRIHLPISGNKFGKPQNKGFAYIDFADADSLASALELSEKLVAGRRVLIKNANSFEGRPKNSAQGGKDGQTGADEGKPPSRRIFVGNLDFNSTVEDLEAHFGVCGNIVHTHMATFEDSGKCKGFAWVEFENLDDARKAMRGWVEEGHAASTQQHDTQDDSQATGQNNAGQKRSTRRIWLQKINGRKLRMEYAEDKSVRYQKRFGKDKDKREGGPHASTSQQGNGVDASGDLETHGIEEVDASSEQQRAQTQRPGDRGERKKRKVRAGGYSEEVVNKMIGGIVESTGSKVTFD